MTAIATMYTMNASTKDLTSLSKRILHALEYSGTKKATLAHLIGVKPQVIQYLCQGNSQSSRFTFEIATALEVNPKWLATGDGPMLTKPTSQHEEFKKIPLLATNSAKNYNNHDELLAIKNPTIIYTDNSNAHFAYMQEDPSMEPLIPNGSQLLFSYSDSISTPNNIVLAFIKTLNTTVIRQIKQVNQSKILHPLNDTLFKPIPIDENVRLIAKLTECRWKVDNKD